jgi:hypothetical protein
LYHCVGLNAIGKKNAAPISGNGVICPDCRLDAPETRRLTFPPLQHPLSPHTARTDECIVSHVCRSPVLANDHTAGGDAVRRHMH